MGLRELLLPYKNQGKAMQNQRNLHKTKENNKKQLFSQKQVENHSKTKEIHSQGPQTQKKLGKPKKNKKNKD